MILTKKARYKNLDYGVILRILNSLFPFLDGKYRLKTKPEGSIFQKTLDNILYKLYSKRLDVSGRDYLFSS